MKDKHILFTILIVVLISSAIATVISKNSEFYNPNSFGKKNISFDRQVDVGKEKLFQAFSNPEKYPQILPNNYKSYKWINGYPNKFVAKETVGEAGLFLELDTSHILVPYEKHTLEITSGDAKDSRIELTFNGNDTSTILHVKMDLKFSGILSPFNLIPDDQIIHASNTVIDKFVQYAKKSN